MKRSHHLNHFIADYGMLFVLIGLCVLFSALTLQEQRPEGADAGERVAKAMLASTVDPGVVLVAIRDTEDDRSFAVAFQEGVGAETQIEVRTVSQGPAEARSALEAIQAEGNELTAIAVTGATATWGIFANLSALFPEFAETPLLQAEGYLWPSFLKRQNLLNISNQIAVIAIMAIGMTMVIITGGIDLSVGSLLAFSAVIAAWLIQEVGGGVEASGAAMFLSSLAAITACGMIGAFSGTMITVFSIPPFIVTLSMMLVGSGFAYIIAQGQSIYEIPEQYKWLGHGSDAFSIPNASVLMIGLYLLAHFVMSRTALGRRIYAVGGNPEAARLSGVPVKKILLLVYALSGVFAGIGGVITASQLQSGSPTYGLMFELYVIAAVVVGGTSLSGGSGKILGTLIGAFIIAIIRNGMNLTGVESYQQKVVLGLVILAAVLADQLKKKDWKSWGPFRVIQPKRTQNKP